MVAILESHLSLLEREAEDPLGASVAERAELIGDMIALHVAVFEGMERHLGANGITEMHRQMVPLFRRWLHTGRRLITWARDLKAAGVVIDLDALLSAINRAKPVAEDFEHYVELNQRLDRGPAGPHRPLAEVIDELRAKDQQAG